MFYNLDRARQPGNFRHSRRLDRNDVTAGCDDPPPTGGLDGFR